MFTTKVTILLSTYNGINYLPVQLDSIFSQTHKDFEILIRDDGSTDGTVDLLRQYANKYPKSIKLFPSNPIKLGAAKSFMRLLEAAVGDYIMFCDQDDLWLPSKIESSLKHIKFLDNKYGSDIPLMAFGDLTVVNSDLKVIHKSFWKHQKLNPKIVTNWKAVLAQNTVTGCTMIINSAAKRLCLPFPCVDILHDQWIAVNVARSGHIAWTEDTTILYRQHNSNSLGAKTIGILYAFQWLKKINTKYLFYREMSEIFSNQVTVFELLYYKLIINLRRLI